MIPTKHFYMIRHGQTEANANQIMAGSLDSPLTETGKDQARQVHSVLETLKIKPAKIIHSQLSRARDTATILNEALNVPMEEEPDYAELDAGDWEGVPYEECRTILRDWVDPPNGEPYQDFLDRIQQAKARILAANDDPVMVVSHGGVFRAFWKLYGIRLDGVRNCRLYEFEPKPEPSGFPWAVWRYDVDDGVVRVKIDPENQDPTSEIAA